jgi:hypothetical protein
MVRYSYELAFRLHSEQGYSQNMKGGVPVQIQFSHKNGFEDLVTFSSCVTFIQASSNSLS